MAEGSRLVGGYLLITPEEHDAIIKAANQGDDGAELGRVLSPLMSPVEQVTMPWRSTYPVLVIQPDGQPHEIPGTDKIAITPAWDKTSIYVLPAADAISKHVSHPTRMSLK